MKLTENSTLNIVFIFVGMVTLFTVLAEFYPTVSSTMSGSGFPLWDIIETIVGFSVVLFFIFVTGFIVTGQNN